MFRIIYLDNPLAQIGSNEVWDLFQKSLRLRVTGYRKEYPENVLPLGRDDFFSTQILIFDDLNLVCTFKFTRYDMCQHYGTAFPMIQALEDGGIEEYSATLNTIVKNAEQKKHLISYCGGWAIHPSAREDKNYSRKIRDIVSIAHHQYLESFGIDEALILGVIRFKAHLFQEYLGYKRIEQNGEKIGEVKLSFLNHEPAYTLHLTQSSEEVKALCEENNSILESAKFYSANEEFLQADIKKAA